MGDKVAVSNLIAGDVCLYQGEGFISSMIRLLDGEPYSHASIYIGEDQTGVPKVAEMLPDGINVRDFATSISGANYVDAYRYVNANHQPLGSPDVNSKPLIDRIEFFTAPDNWQRYGYEQILLLAMLCSTRKVPGLVGEIVRRVLDSASEILAKMIHAGQEPMICSELVFRCYTEASPAYELLIVGSDIARAVALQNVLAGGATQAPSAPDDPQTQKAISSFLANYSMAKGQKIAFGAATGVGIDAQVSATQALAALAVADFVTPNDLSRSPNLQKLGTIAG